MGFNRNQSTHSSRNRSDNRNRHNNQSHDGKSYKDRQNRHYGKRNDNDSSSKSFGKKRSYRFDDSNRSSRNKSYHNRDAQGSSNTRKDSYKDRKDYGKKRFFDHKRSMSDGFSKNNDRNYHDNDRKNSYNRDGHRGYRDSRPYNQHNDKSHNSDRHRSNERGKQRFDSNRSRFDRDRKPYNHDRNSERKNYHNEGSYDKRSRDGKSYENNSYNNRSRDNKSRNTVTSDSYKRSQHDQYVSETRRNSDGTISFPSQNPYTHRRPNEPVMPRGMKLDMLSSDEHERLRGLAKEHADNIGLHILAAYHLLDEEPEQALEHAKWVALQASRIDFAREVLAFVAYRIGNFSLALREFKTAKRMNGYNDYLPFIADCERGLGHFDKAIEYALSDEAKALQGESKAEMFLVYAGALADKKEFAKAIAIVDKMAKSQGLPGEYRMRALQAEQYFFEESGHEEQALQLDDKLDILESKFADDDDEEEVVIDYDLERIDDDDLEELGINLLSEHYSSNDMTNDRYDHTNVGDTDENCSEGFAYHNVEDTHNTEEESEHVDFSLKKDDLDDENMQIPEFAQDENVTDVSKSEYSITEDLNK